MLLVVPKSSNEKEKDARKMASFSVLFKVKVNQNSAFQLIFYKLHSWQ